MHPQKRLANHSPFLNILSQGVPITGAEPQYRHEGQVWSTELTVPKDHDVFHKQALRLLMKRQEISKISSPFTLPRKQPSPQGLNLFVRGISVRSSRIVPI
jgi:hypothetical protein